ncbi:PTS sugar transporter subunit IIC [Vibrio sp. S4M6]|uniref:PTS sugar transporter subunit IIC n=1 Tax=Vibrio sinus TaxID=2946865 RepID=UPI00202A4CFC|nr:PTS sugar transporter subunit IIC [Vibrio sinus]MCL9781140.1 PTS sugar transporter subunit IIC [Vibrio sinus]
MGLYSKMMNVVENHIAPIATKVGTQPHIIAIRDGFISAMPFLIVGSIMLIVANPPFDAHTTSSFGQLWVGLAKHHWGTITMPYFMTMGLMSVFVSIGTAYSLAKHYKLDGLTAAMLSLTAFLLASAPQVHNAMSMEFLGGKGVFTAIICAIWSVELIRLLQKYNITIKMPEQVPPAIARSFELLYPVIGIMLTVYPISLFLQSEYSMLLPAAIMKIFEPLVALGDSLPAILIAVTIANLLWFAGIHGDNIVTGLLNPIFMANIAANAALITHGQEATHILTAPYWSFYLCIGGSGSTLVLAFMYLKSRSVHLKTIGKLSVVPAIFNINEPLIFGSPVVMNPIMFIPLLLVPIVNVLLSYTALHLHLVETMIAMAPWTTPAPIGAMISAAWDYRAFILVLVLIVVDTLIWYPFFKAYERQLCKEEASSESLSETSVSPSSVNA